MAASDLWLSGMTRLTIATTCVPGDLPTKLERIASAGFSGVELYEPDLTGFTGTLEEVATIADALGLNIDVFQPFHDFEGLGGKDRDAAYARLDHKLGLMNSLSAKTLLVGTSTRKDSSPNLNDVVKDFTELAERAAKARCRAALIALPWAAHLRTEMDALDVISAVDHPNFGMGLNSFFSLADGSQAARLRDIPGERIFHVQLSDAPAIDYDITRLKSHFGLLPGQGDLNLPSFVRVLSRTATMVHGPSPE